MVCIQSLFCLLCVLCFEQGSKHFFVLFHEAGRYCADVYFANLLVLSSFLPPIPLLGCPYPPVCWSAGCAPFLSSSCLTAAGLQTLSPIIPFTRTLILFYKKISK